MISVSWLQPWNGLWHAVIFDPRCTLVTLDATKAKSPIEVMPVPTSPAKPSWVFWNAEEPMVRNALGKAVSRIVLTLRNAPAPIEVTPEGMDVMVRLVPWKA